MHTCKRMAQSLALAMGLMGPIFALANPPDSSQISPLGDPAWVASLSGPDFSRPAMNIGKFEVTVANVPRSGGTGGNDRLPDSTQRRGDSTVRNGQILNNGRVYLIGAERITLSKAGAILLAPGRAAELGDLRVPFVRVYVSAPSGSALDVDRLVSQRPTIGMFNALFAPALARRGDSGASAIASLSAPEAASGSVGVTAVAHTASLPSIAEVRVAAYAAPVAEGSVVLLPIPRAQVEERVLIAFAAPVEDRSGNWISIPLASVEDRSFVAFAAPVEERSGLLAAIPPASVEDRSFVAFAAPILVVAAKDTAQTRVEARDLAPIPVRLAAIHKRIPSVMIDRKGGFFFM